MRHFLLLFSDRNRFQESSKALCYRREKSHAMNQHGNIYHITKTTSFSWKHIIYIDFKIASREMSAPKRAFSVMLSSSCRGRFLFVFMGRINKLDLGGCRCRSDAPPTSECRSEEIKLFKSQNFLLRLCSIYRWKESSRKKTSLVMVVWNENVP